MAGSPPSPDPGWDRDRQASVVGGTPGGVRKVHDVLAGRLEKELPERVVRIVEVAHGQRDDRLGRGVDTPEARGSAGIGVAAPALGLQPTAVSRMATPNSRAARVVRA